MACKNTEPYTYCAYYCETCLKRKEKELLFTASEMSVGELVEYLQHFPADYTVAISVPPISDDERRLYPHGSMSFCRRVEFTYDEDEYFCCLSINRKRTTETI